MNPIRQPAKRDQHHMNRVLAMLIALLIVLAGAAYCGLIQQALEPSKAIEQKCTSTPSAVTAQRPHSLSSTPIYSYEIINTYPHDRAAFTQGLVFAEGGFLYEGTGLYGQSSLRQVELNTGTVAKIHRLPDTCFGEGITLWKDKLIQLTWQEHVGFVYAKDSFRLVKTFTYPTEGWGLTHDGKRLILSDGTSTLYFLDPESFQEIGRLEVRDQGVPVTWLNELEYINGEIYANVWQTDYVAVISPETGQVLRWVDLAGLLSAGDRSQPVDVLNGIAYDAQGDRLFVTGKLWPKLFEIQLVLPP